jgi:hypothetical protein
MKALFLSIALTISVLSFSQSPNHESCGEMEVETPDELKAFEPCVVYYSKHALDAPLNTEDFAVEKSRLAVFIWMTKTPDYSFVLPSAITKFEKKNSGLMTILFCCLALEALEGKGDYESAAYERFAAYCKDPKNEVKQTKHIKKLIAAAEKDNLTNFMETY